MEIKKYIDGLYTADIRSTIDLKVLKKSCLQMEEIITKSFRNDENDYKGKSSATTQLYRKYNFLMYPLPGIHNIHFNISGNEKPLLSCGARVAIVTESEIEIIE